MQKRRGGGRVSFSTRARKCHATSIQGVVHQHISMRMSLCKSNPYTQKRTCRRYPPRLPAMSMTIFPSRKGNGYAPPPSSPSPAETSGHSSCHSGPLPAKAKPAGPQSGMPVHHTPACNALPGTANEELQGRKRDMGGGACRGNGGCADCSELLFALQTVAWRGEPPPPARENSSPGDRNIWLMTSYRHSGNRGDGEIQPSPAEGS